MKPGPWNPYPAYRTDSNGHVWGACNMRVSSPLTQMHIPGNQDGKKKGGVSIADQRSLRRCFLNEQNFTKVTSRMGVFPVRWPTRSPCISSFWDTLMHNSGSWRGLDCSLIHKSWVIWLVRLVVTSMEWWKGGSRAFRHQWQGCEWA